ncbi:2-polyprenyl-6-methoxyphenol hydroxylase-like FAD-dependent oxidoreductase [Thermocatellispora tengchongensis]|uniref:2-polyprenyl-6-methoxyphenol hydroxylase-like FAD-dependent oxidoreductase n=1 Tax=Thermocatellispora tengchongensis TaxID=1073253 RepID=A0A840P1H7_9ACTN|nr:FAD-dependent monooxygenase [Thermocatellispora tengchongensis]MBB5131320.1 2-polyprenyl-6-methoxyphenol hydroxylase-like FAD-dependent oxidoreductase [Thermocatellispora tengchongensis]
MEDVIVVGAGPVGLWLAAELRRAGVPVLVLERAEAPSPHSKALTLHPRMIELLAMRGMDKAFLDEGIVIPTGHFGLLDTRLDFRPLPTRHPYTLFFPQARTERLLGERAIELGARVVRGHAVTGLTQDADGVELSVTGPDGPYVVRARYVVGCDGAGSTVRGAAGIPFPGTGSTVYGFLGDVRLDDPPQAPALSAHTTEGGAMIVGMPDGYHRIVGIMPEQPDGAGTELTLDELRAKVVRVLGRDFGMRDPAWLSRFGNASRQAEAYRAGRVLLAGDAAHMHFPTGGVGLNVGVQDAMNLGWRLAAVAQGRAPESLLDGYHAERHPVGAELMLNSKAQTALMTAFTPEGQALRALLGKLVAAHPSLSLDLASRLAALNVAYPPADPGAHPLTGARVPDLALRDGRTVYGLLHEARHVLLDLGAGAASMPPEVAGYARDLGTATYEGGLAEDAPQEWRAVGAALIRPDGHVHWAVAASG